MRQYSLTVLEGPDIGRTHQIRLGKTIIGRAPSQTQGENPCHHWTLIDKTVSREHIEITLDDPGVPILRHLSGTNDTFVNRRKTTEENLQVGQIIQMGQTALVLEVTNVSIKF